jgi:phosphoenolpyruvate-protein phosphotransferase
MRGGPTDHSSILVRALGIPAIIAPSIQDFHSGTIVGIDGSRGKLWIAPSSQTLETLKKRQYNWLAQQERLLGACHEPAVTQDGKHIRIAANIMSVVDAKTAIRCGAEAIGLLRTEFLYLTRNTPPSESEQIETLSQISEFMGNYPVYVRTLDVGGDKTIPYLDLPRENNPFLGVRSIRFSLQTPELFQTQLRAILRASVGSDIRVMFPMISTMDEVTQVLQCLEKAHRALENEQIAHRWPLEIALMIETPSAALLTASLAKYADYFSIGTNDLTQYTLAAERGHPTLSKYSDGLHPTVLYLIQHVVNAVHQHGKRVGVCGELACDPLAVPILIGLGIDELSLTPDGIPRVKDIIRKIDMVSALALAERALQTDSASEVRSMAKEFIAQL